MEKGFIITAPAENTKANGPKTRNMAMESLNMPTGTNMKVIGKTVKEMVRGSMNIRTATAMKENGSTT